MSKLSKDTRRRLRRLRKLAACRKLSPRSAVALAMIVACRSQELPDRRRPRGGARNDQDDFLVDVHEVVDDE